MPIWPRRSPDRKGPEPVPSPGGDADTDSAGQEAGQQEDGTGMPDAQEAGQQEDGTGMPDAQEAGQQEDSQ